MTVEPAANGLALGKLIHGAQSCEWLSKKTPKKQKENNIIEHAPDPKVPYSGLENAGLLPVIILDIESGSVSVSAGSSAS